MPYSQTLRLRTTCSGTTEYYKNLAFNKQKSLGKTISEGRSQLTNSECRHKKYIQNISRTVNDKYYHIKY